MLTESQGPHPELEAVIVALAHQVAAMALARTEDGTLPVETHHFISRTADYSPTGGLTVFSDEVTRQLPSSAVLQEIVSSVRASQPTFEESAGRIAAARGGAELPRARGALEHFLNRIAGQVVESGSTESIEGLARSFLTQALGGDIHWQGIIMLDGITVEEAVEIVAGVTLRPPRNEDFLEETYLHAPPLRNVASIPTAVIEVSIASSSQPDMRGVVNVLNLFRLCSVDPIQETWTSNSLLPGRNVTSIPHRYLMSPSIKGTWSTFDTDRLIAFLTFMDGKLPSNPLGHHPQGGWRTALKYYFHALKTATDAEERLAQSVSALESLLAQGKSGELTRLLSQRAASLLRFAGLAEGEVLSNVRRAYSLRSIYAHGSRFKEANRQRVRELWVPIMDYARLCLLKAIELDATSWQQVLDLTDEALLVPSAYVELKELVEGGVWELSRDAAQNSLATERASERCE